MVAEYEKIGGWHEFANSIFASFTPTNAIAKEMGISRSKLFERIGRGMLEQKILTPTEAKGLDAIASGMNLTRFALVEQIGRGAAEGG